MSTGGTGTKSGVGLVLPGNERVGTKTYEKLYVRIFVRTRDDDRSGDDEPRDRVNEIKEGFAGKTIAYNTYIYIYIYLEGRSSVRPSAL